MYSFRQCVRAACDTDYNLSSFLTHYLNSTQRFTFKFRTHDLHNMPMVHVIFRYILVGLQKGLTTFKDRYGLSGFSGTPPSEPNLSTPPPPGNITSSKIFSSAILSCDFISDGNWDFKLWELYEPLCPEQKLNWVSPSVLVYTTHASLWLCMISLYPSLHVLNQRHQVYASFRWRSRTSPSSSTRFENMVYAPDYPQN